MDVAVSIDGQALLATARVFNSGSRGFYASGKVVLDGKRYQVSVNLVEIGSKPVAAPVAAAPAKANGSIGK